MIRFEKNPEELARTIYEDYYRKKNNLPKDPARGSIDEKDCIFLATRMDDENERIYGFLGREDGFADLNEYGWQVQRWIWVSYPRTGVVQLMKTLPQTGVVQAMKMYTHDDFHDKKWWSPERTAMEKEHFIFRLTKVIEHELMCFNL